MKLDKTADLAALSQNLSSSFQTFRSQTASTLSRRYPKELIESTCKAYLSGVPRKELVKITGVSWANLKRWFQKSPASKKPRQLKVVVESSVSLEAPTLSHQNILIRLKSGVVIELPGVECLTLPFLKTLSVLEVA